VTPRRLLLALGVAVVLAFVVATVVFGWGHYASPDDLFPPE
jgi:hypothetical protein